MGNWERKKIVYKYFNAPEKYKELGVTRNNEKDSCDGLSWNTFEHEFS